MLPRSSDVEACWRTSRRQTTLAAVRRHARCCQALHALPCPVTSPASWLCDGPWLRVMVSSLNGIRQCAILCSLQQRCSGRPHSRREGVGETRVRLWWHQECAFTRTHTHAAEFAKMVLPTLCTTCHALLPVRSSAALLTNLPCACVHAPLLRRGLCQHAGGLDSDPPTAAHVSGHTVAACALPPTPSRRQPSQLTTRCSSVSGPPPSCTAAPRATCCATTACCAMFHARGMARCARRPTSGAAGP